MEAKGTEVNFSLYLFTRGNDNRVGRFIAIVGVVWRGWLRIFASFASTGAIACATAALTRARA